VKDKWMTFALGVCVGAAVATSYFVFPRDPVQQRIAEYDRAHARIEACKKDALGNRPKGCDDLGEEDWIRLAVEVPKNEIDRHAQFLIMRRPSVAATVS
jgi:hypothetical protein